MTERLRDMLHSVLDAEAEGAQKKVHLSVHAVQVDQTPDMQGAGMSEDLALGHAFQLSDCPGRDPEEVAGREREDPTLRVRQ
ncbi:hypothetical protein [Methylobacterium sp. Leaf85]|uniref:hypothetical protein n=1 Tax=Methylobacterium sp. Leaf85 TaxID=1736241 RepID=UPI0006FC032A|nr:hypothetical protein [Methylobacterium sp. Leaf85]KQO45253.1 hypothetical protein ASF08_23515 [Methylobacterium sp. Leaf85]